MPGQSIYTPFNGVLKSLNTKEIYTKKPPQGPPSDWPGLTTSDSFTELNLNTFGEDPLVMSPYDKESLMLVEQDGIFPKEVKYPTANQLSDLNICAIDGSNERIERGAFFLILVRAALVNFRYNKSGLRPYSYQTIKDLTAMTIADKNIFDRDRLNLTTSYSLNENEDEIRNYVSGYLRREEKEPLFIQYDREKNVQNPASHALGWGVKLMQTLELLLLQEVKTDYKTVCIKDGPIFSPSVSKKDTKQLLQIIKSWKNQILIGCSKRIGDSRLLVQLLAQKANLRNQWFPDANLSDETVKSIPTDSTILSRHLKPGERTALIQGISDTRKKIITGENGEEGDLDFIPLNCYYLSRTRPYTYMRMEIPKLFYDQDPKKVEEAIQIVAWQHELGKLAPLVQLLADKRCGLSEDKKIVERMTNVALREKKLEFLENFKTLS